MTDELSSEAIRLEPLRAKHAEPMFAGLVDECLYQFVSDSPPATLDALRSRYERLEARRSPSGEEQWLNWIVIRRVDNRVCGYVQATVASATTNIAYVLFSALWGHGLAREAVKLMLMHLRDRYAVEQVTATVDTRNLRSVRLLEALDFKQRGLRRNAEWIHGVLTDELLYVLELGPCSQG